MEQRDGGCRLERVTTDWHYGHQKWKPSGARWMAEWGVQVCVILSDALMADRPSLIQPITPRDKPFRDINPVFRREAPMTEDATLETRMPGKARRQPRCLAAEGATRLPLHSAGQANGR